MSKKYMLSVFIDLSDPKFARDNPRAADNVLAVLSGAAEAVLVGSGATLMIDAYSGRTVGTFAITEDPDGKDKAAFDELAASIKLLKSLQRARAEQWEKPSEPASTTQH